MKNKTGFYPVFSFYENLKNFLFYDIIYIEKEMKGEFI